MAARAGRLTLYGLPTELQEHIISFIPPSASILALSLTCRHFHTLLQIPLYTSVRLINNKPEKFATTLAEHPERKQLVKHLEVDCFAKVSEDEGETSACTYAGLYSEFSNLESLSLTSGYWHWDDRDTGRKDREVVNWETDQNLLNDILLQAAIWDDNSTYKFRTWAHLRSLTLDFSERNGQGSFLIWDPVVFILPALEELVIGGMRYHEGDGEDLVNSPYKGRTPLKRLVLKNSYIYVEALQRFLAMPKALKHLSLLHNDNYSHHEMGPNGGNANDDSAGWLTALDQQMHGLESLVMSPEIEEYLEVDRDESPCIQGLRTGVGVEIAWSKPHPEDSYWDGGDWGEPVIELRFTREG